MKIFGSVGLVVCLTFAILSTNIASSSAAGNITDTEQEHEEDEEEYEEAEIPAIIEEEAVVTSSPEERRCEEMIGSITNGDWTGLNVSYDLQSILAKYGGPPGEVNATREERENAPVESELVDERPLPFAPEEYWIYNYTETDNATWRRSEHAVHRFNGSAKEFLEIRGNIIWTPEDFCGKARRADYIVDDRGFGFEVSREYCNFENEDFTCIPPPTMEIGIVDVISGLFASLVGGG